MKIKSYFSHSVGDAIAQARSELGPDAMLVNSRKASPEARHLGDYEVVFASDAPANSQGLPALPASPEAAPAPAERLCADVAELKKELENMRRVLARSVFASPQALGAAPSLADAYSALAASEVSPELAREVVQSAEQRIRGTGSGGAAAGQPNRSIDAGAFEQALVEELQSRFTVQATLGRGPATPRIVALVGPAGAGKTTTLVKLAVNYGLAARRPILLLSADTYRVAAAEQLRSYAAILGVGFQIVETISALAQAIAENSGKDLIFIDTPGMGAGDLDDSTPLARFLSTRGDIDTHLVLSASMKSADLSRMVDSFESFGAQRLLFTKLDETGSFGPILNEAVRTGKPLSFFTNGQKIPEDLEAASGRLVELLLSRRAARARSAA
jgi:flagellar biosynthesis protein FlhF